MTVNDAHALYMVAVKRNQHKVQKSAVRKSIKPRTISDKIILYERNMKDEIGALPIGSITHDHLKKIIFRITARDAHVQANRTGTEMNVFFKWASGPRGEAAGIKMDANPAAMIRDLWNTESEGRERWLEGDELPLLLKALALEDRIHQRPIVLWLLTGCRFREVLEFEMSNYIEETMIITKSAAKNHNEHPIRLGAWGRSLMPTDQTYLTPSPKKEQICMLWGWPKIIARIRKKMEEIGGVEVEHFTPHDLRRTFASHMEELVDDVLLERMMNHAVKGVAKRYNRNKRAAAMAAGFDLWDRTLSEMAREAGVAEQLGVPPLPEPDVTPSDEESTPQALT